MPALLPFLLRKIVEATKESSHWAVNRTAIFVSSKQEEKEATRNTAVMFLSTAIGGATSRNGIAYFGFSFTLGIFVVASALIGFPAALLWQIPKQCSSQKTPRAKDLLDLRSRGRMFWFVSFILLSFSLAF